jgi:glycosyltransferase involved in cell wall biosynthesis
LTQQEVTVEVIVVDDGSGDDPASVLPPDPRITLLTTSRGGVSRARNHGLTAAQARMVIFLDADDTISDPLRARDQLAMLDRRPDLGIVHSGWEVFEDGRPVLARTPWTRLPSLDLDQWVEYPVVLPSAMAFRRDGIRDVGAFDESLRQVEDLDIVLRMLLRGWTAAWLERVTTRYHQRAVSASADVDAQASALAVVLDRLFADPATPDSVTVRQRAIRYNLHVWLASRYHRVGRMSHMADQLAASSVWFDGPVAPLALDWVHRFVDARADAGDPPLDVRALTAEPAWQSLIRSPAGALIERGVAVSGRATARRPTAQKEAKPAATPDLWSPAVEVRELPPPALDCSLAWARGYGRHRSGWTAALEALRPLHVADGVLVDGFVEHTFQPTDRSPYRSPWIGFLHNPAELPPWYPIDQSAVRLLADDRFRASLGTCRGLFTFSAALRDWWAPRVDVPVEAVPFPTGTPLLRFTVDGFLHNPFPRIVQVGTWLRKLHAVHDLPVHRMQRTIVHQHELYIDELFAAERSALRLRVDESLVETLPFLDDHGYDELLSCNLVLVELYATSANNAVVECLVRGTPILVNPLPAVREYLGDDYPFYFSSRTEAARKAEDDELVAAAHRYLVNRPQAQQLSGTCFAGAIAGSAIYRGLAERLTTR